MQTMFYFVNVKWKIFVYDQFTFLKDPLFGLHQLYFRVEYLHYSASDVKNKSDHLFIYPRCNGVGRLRMNILRERRAKDDGPWNGRNFSIFRIILQRIESPYKWRHLVSSENFNISFNFFRKWSYLKFCLKHI